MVSYYSMSISGYHMNDYFRRKHPLGQGTYFNMVFWHKSRQPGLGKTIEIQIGEARHRIILHSCLSFTFHRFTRKHSFLFLLNPIDFLHFLDVQTFL